MSSGLTILNADDKVTVVQNNVNALQTLTISSVTGLQNHLDQRYKK